MRGQGPESGTKDTPTTRICICKRLDQPQAKGLFFNYIKKKLFPFSIQWHVISCTNLVDRELNTRLLKKYYYIIPCKFLVEISNVSSGALVEHSTVDLKCIITFLIITSKDLGPSKDVASQN